MNKLTYEEFKETFYIPQLTDDVKKQLEESSDLMKDFEEIVQFEYEGYLEMDISDEEYRKLLPTDKL